MNELEQHDWLTVKYNPPSGPWYYGRKCRKCGLKRYARGSLTRFTYPDGRIFESATIDEPSCEGLVQ